MNTLNWTEIKRLCSDKNALGLKLILIFMVIYIIRSADDHKRIKFFLIFGALLLVALFVKEITQPLLWYIFLIILITDLVGDYFVRANHHFLLIYMTVLIIGYVHNLNLENFTVNIKLLLAIVLLFSGIQKLISPQFISGDFYYYMLNTGKFFKPLLHFNHEIQDIIASNHEKIIELGKSNPNTKGTVILHNVIPNLDVVSRVYAWVSIAIELLTGVLILWKPKHIFTHILFILLILGIFITRLENGFMALLAISGIWLSENTKVRIVYVTMTVLFLALMILQIGFY